MSEYKHTERDPRWADLYRVGGISALTISVFTTLAVIAFFIWPYVPGSAPVNDIFAVIGSGLLGALSVLDTALLVGMLAQLPLLLALYIALRRINDSYALLAVVGGLVSIVAVLPARPVLEVMRISDQYMAATSDAARLQYLAAGEALLSVFHGTSWTVSILFMSVGYLILFSLMLKSPSFRRATAIIGLVTNIGALGFMIPAVGPLLLLISTLSAIVLGIPLGMDLLRLKSQETQADV